MPGNDYHQFGNGVELVTIYVFDTTMEVFNGQDCLA